jgi:hypothetical protein
MKNYVLCTTLENESIEVLKNIKKDINLQHAIIHIVKIVEIQVFSTEFVSSYYPQEADYGEIEATHIKKLTKLAQEIGIDDNKLLLKRS